MSWRYLAVSRCRPKHQTGHQASMLTAYLHVSVTCKSFVRYTCQAMLLHSSSISGCSLLRSELPLPAFCQAMKASCALSSCKPGKIDYVVCSCTRPEEHIIACSCAKTNLQPRVSSCIAAGERLFGVDSYRRLYIILDQVERVLSSHDQRSSFTVSSRCRHQ